MDNQKEYNILNGQYKLITKQHEMRMSHFVNGFAIINTTTKTQIINLLNSIWHLTSFEEQEEILILQCEKYPYRIPYTITMNLKKGIMNIHGVKCKMEQYREFLQ